MRVDNKFYIMLNQTGVIAPGLIYSVYTGEIISGPSNSVACTQFMSSLYDKGPINQIYLPNNAGIEDASVICYDKNKKFIGSAFDLTINNSILLPEGTCYINLNFSTPEDIHKDIRFYLGREVQPHYKTVNKTYKKESGQMFFREALEGNITLFGYDFEFVSKLNLDEEPLFILVQNSKIYSTNKFHKNDCTYDYAKKSVQLKLSPFDLYTDVLAKYDNTYDLIKLAPAITRGIVLTKRALLQIYVQGGNTVSNYFSGAYWEDDVNETVDSDDTLQHKYHFAKVKTFEEISLLGIEDINSNVKSTYKMIPDSDTWPGVPLKNAGGYKVIPEIYFYKVYSAGETIGYNEIMSITGDGTLELWSLSKNTKLHTFVRYEAPYIHYRAAYDVYKIYIRYKTFYSETGSITYAYESVLYYAKDEDSFILYNRDYKMVKSNGIGGSKPDVNAPKFDMGIIEYGVYARLLVDVDKFTLRDTVYNTYDLPFDDFTITRANYKKCVGTLDVSIYQTDVTTDEPTKYGINDNEDQYFTSNFIPGSAGIEGIPRPICRSSWANTSLWTILGEPYDEVEIACRKEFELKDSFHIADTIKAILHKINPEIRHEGTTEYSEYLYGNNVVLGNCQIYITQKTNILKGDYDKPAKKAEVTFKQIMEMLKDCFRCYWFIDTEGRFRIEHISYFINGMTYNNSQAQVFNLLEKIDRFNKKELLYFQQEISYDKSDLSSRYEFTWSDDCTDLFGNLNIDITSKAVQEDKVENISPDKFSSELDYMMYVPDKFSDDGFALIMARDKKVPIQAIEGLRDDEFVRTYKANIQNYYASWLNLAKTYMQDMPSTLIDYNIAPNNAYVVENIKPYMQHTIQYIDTKDPEVYSLIKTQVGNGMIEEISSAIDSKLIKVKLIYKPI